MVGLVLVSHSRGLADALVDLVRQVAGTEAPIAIAAGIGDDRQELGTDAIELMEAIQSVDSPEGVVVLMDLGSAVLSAKMALELLPPEVAERVVLCPAPFIEGAVAAAVQAGLGSSAELVSREAKSALLPKIDQLAEEVKNQGQPAPTIQAASMPGEGQELILVIRNLHGLHARPAAQFVRAAGRYDADILIWNVTNGKGPVNAKSLNAVATLGAIKDHQVGIRATGSQAREAIKALKELIESGFGEIEAAETAAALIPQTTADNVFIKAGFEPGDGISVIPVSEGFALGPLFKYRQATPQVSSDLVDDPNKSWSDLTLALESAKTAIRDRKTRLAKMISPDQAAIFDAHELILDDPDLLSATHQIIREERLNPGAAWQRGIRAVVEKYNELDDPYLRQRAVDVQDVGNQVLTILAGKTSLENIDLPGEVILFATDLTPTETSQLDMKKVLGIITSGGGPTSHSAILARALGIPAVSGAPGGFEATQDGTIIGLDGFVGRIILSPGKAYALEIMDKRKDWLEKRENLRRFSQETAATRDGHRVEVCANAGGVIDAQKGAENGAEGIGLLRTEFLFMTRESAPTEGEQLELLLQIGAMLTGGGKRNLATIVRTLDVGGDKELPYVDQGEEANPYLGVRALRLCLRRPDLFLPQLKAILRANADYHFRIMFPMVANLSEILSAKKLLNDAHHELLNEKRSHGWPIELGIMVEIPAAALMSHVLAEEVDFFSIGTNDLTQYTLAAERGNPALADMADGLHPAVLQLVSNVIQSAHHFGKWVGVCGELAGDPIALPVLVGLGVDELSMNAGSIPLAKATLRMIDLSETKALAEQALASRSSLEARNLARQFADAVVGPRLSQA